MLKHTLKVHLAQKETFWIVDDDEGPLYVRDIGDAVRRGEGPDADVVVQKRRENLLKAMLSATTALIDAEARVVGHLKMPAMLRKPSFTVGETEYRGKVGLGIASSSCTFKGPRRKVALRITRPPALKKSTITFERDDDVPLAIAALVAVNVYHAYFTD